MSNRTKTKKPRILVVDDEPQNLIIFRTAFRRDLKVFTADSAEKALALLDAEGEVPVIVTDQRMPEMTGVDFLVKVRERWPDSIRMVLTAFTDIDAVIDAINRGNVYKFIYKPWDRDDLLQTILNAVETYELRRRNKALNDELLNRERLATVGKLVAGLAHEIGNQLCTSAISEAILKRYKNDEFLNRQVGIIRNSLNMVHRMVAEIRDFSQSRNHDLTLQPSSVGAIVEEAVNLLSYDGEVRKKKVEVEITEDVIASIHEGKVQQVVINLVKNAAQAIPQDREGLIRVEVLSRDELAVIRIADNGAGIPEEIRDQIWEPFFTTKEATGAGLGLDICRQIVEAHGGEIRYETEVGVGTTFEVLIPGVGFESGRPTENA